MTAHEDMATRRRSLAAHDRRAIGQGLLILRRVGVRVTERLDRTVGAAVSGNSAVAMLMTLRAEGPQRPAWLASVTGLTTGGLSKAVDRLARHGFVTRGTKGTDGDGRSVRIALTDKGRRTASIIDDVASGSLRELADELDELVSIAGQVGVPAGRADPTASTTVLARLARVGVQLSEALRSSPIDDHAAVLVLCVLDGDGPCRPGRLVEVLGMSSGGVTKLVDRLAARGLVERSYGTLADRRGVVISITPAGLEELDTVLGFVVSHLQEASSAAASLTATDPSA
jgi:DNA-binding MarR family transcriptional regulator